MPRMRGSIGTGWRTWESWPTRSTTTRRKLPGLGDVDWSKYFSVLGETGYDGPMCIEVEDRAYEGSLEKRQGALVQSGRYLRQFMAE